MNDFSLKMTFAAGFSHSDPKIILCTNIFVTNFWQDISDYIDNTLAKVSYENISG
jgi:hypothetical protein